MVPLAQDETSSTARPASRFRYAARLAWLAVQLILIICLGERGVLFFYQGF